MVTVSISTVYILNYQNSESMFNIFVFLLTFFQQIWKKKATQKEQLQVLRIAHKPRCCASASWTPLS